MPNRIHILNTTIDNYSMSHTLDIIDQSISNNKSLHHVVVNAGKIVAMQEDAQLMQSVNKADLINADEVWCSSSTNAVVPIVKVDDNMINDGKAGSITMKIYEITQDFIINF